MEYDHRKEVKRLEEMKSLGSVLLLMQNQKKYIHQVARLILQICSDAAIANNRSFQEFAGHFLSFSQCQAGSEGYGRALDARMSCGDAGVDRLLDQEIIVTAEQLAVTIACWDIAAREPQVSAHPHIPLLSYGICLLEETELKIIEEFETYSRSCRNLYLPN